jgi:hypothetical protein
MKMLARRAIGLVCIASMMGPVIASAETTYAFDFEANGISAKGTLDVLNGQASSGGGTITSSVLVPSPESLTLVTLATSGVNVLDPAANGGATLSYRFGGGTDLIGDTIFNAGAPFISSNGLVFLVSGSNNTGFNMWFSGGESHAGFLAGDNNYNQFDGGTLTVNPVPLPPAVSMLAGALLLLGLGSSLRTAWHGRGGLAYA